MSFERRGLLKEYIRGKLVMIGQSAISGHELSSFPAQALLYRTLLFLSFVVSEEPLLFLNLRPRHSPCALRPNSGCPLTVQLFRAENSLLINLPILKVKAPRKRHLKFKFKFFLIRLCFRSKLFMMESPMVPKFDHRFGSLQPNVWLDYFETVANQTRWTDTEKSLKLIAKVNGSLQESLIKAFHAGHKYSNVRSKFLEIKISSKDCIGQLSQTFDPKNQNLKIFLKYKREAAKILAQKSEDQIYIESVRRSLPAAYQWVSSVNDVDKVLAEQLKQDNKFQRKDDQTDDRKKQRVSLKCLY